MRIHFDEPEVDVIAALRNLPDLPESPRMAHHITVPGDPHRHRKITPRLILEAVRYKYHLLKGADHEQP